MSYEFNPNTGQYELPNPHRLENFFLGIAALGLVVMGVAGMVLVRVNLARYGLGAQLLALGPASIVFVVGLAHGKRLLSQLRFFYGREQTRMLFGADDLGRDAEAAPPPALALRETLRQNAINYREPIRPIDTLLHALMRDLVFAPPPVRRFCEQEFHKIVVVGFVLLLFVIASIGLSYAQASWVGLFYLLLTVYLLRPGQLRRAEQAAPTPSKFRSLVPVDVLVLTLVSVVGPALLVLFTHGRAPGASVINYSSVAALMMVLGLVSSVLFIVVLRHRTLRPQSTSAAAKTETVSMNAHPEQLLTELDREMQRLWTDTIPNHTYLRRRPEVAGESGKFEGELIEETQPVPLESGKLGLADALAAPEYRWLVVLDIFALVLTLVGGALLLASSLSQNVIPTLRLSGVVLLFNGYLAFFGSKWLWKRFRFSSKVYWIELRGSFQTARMDYGNVLQDRVKTQKQLINIEDMTLRVWVTEIDSVSFSTSKTADERGRYIVGMRGLPDEAERLSRLLADFGRQQSIVVAPTASRDLQRAGAIQQLNSAGGPGQPAALAGQATAVVAAAAAGGFCPQCGSPAQPGALFCASCGTSLGASAPRNPA